MEEKEHPTFENKFRKIFFFSWSMCILGAIGSIYFLRKEHVEILGYLFSSLVIFGFTCFIYIFYSLYTVRCCSCNRRTKTIQNLQKSQWVAVFKHCNIEWNLKVGVSTN
jgi:hypothetical protein